MLCCAVAVAMLLLYRFPGAALWSGADEQCTHAAGKSRRKTTPSDFVGLFPIASDCLPTDDWASQIRSDLFRLW